MAKLDEGQIMLSNNIRADIELTITYKIKDSYYCKRNVYENRLSYYS